MKLKVRQILSEALIVAAVILFTFAARDAVADHYFVPSGSMEYTLMPGDRVLVDKTLYGLRVPFTDYELWNRRSPTAGDIVILNSPDEGVRLIKRVVAVGGDVVSVTEGRLVVNGERLDDASDPGVERFGNRRARLNLSSGGGPSVDSLAIPAGMVLVMGDHRGDSRDGRVFGLVEEGEIYGRAFRLYYRRGEGFLWRGL